MASNRILDNELREKVLKTIMDFFTEKNECAFPCVDSDGNDKWIQIVVKVPTGGRDEDGYDGYGVAESYRIKVKEKEEKRRENEEKKQKKIERDKKLREKKKEENGN